MVCRPWPRLVWQQKSFGLFYFCFGDRLLRCKDREVVQMFAAHKMQPAEGSLPAFSFDGLRVVVRFDLYESLYSCCDVEEKLKAISANHWICMNEFSMICCKTVFVFLMSLKCFFFFCSSVWCGIWQLRAAPSLSALCSAWEPCVCKAVCVILSEGEALCSSWHQGRFFSWLHFIGKNKRHSSGKLVWTTILVPLWVM